MRFYETLLRPNLFLTIAYTPNLFLLYFLWCILIFIIFLNLIIWARLPRSDATTTAILKSGRAVDTHKLKKTHKTIFIN